MGSIFNLRELMESIVNLRNTARVQYNNHRPTIPSKAKLAFLRDCN